MKKLIAILSVLALSGTAWAVQLFRHSVEAQALTRDTPNVTAPVAAAKLDLTSVRKLRVTACSCTTSACTAVGGNLTGGDIEIWYESPVRPFDQWSHNPDLKLAVGTPGSPCRTWGDMDSVAANAAGFVMARSNAVTTASGTGIKIVIEGHNYDQ